MTKLSDKAITVISDLEFQQRYYFTKKDIRHHFTSDKQLYDFIYNQRKNGRFIKLNKDKYFLVPIKARLRKWTDHPLIVADELMDGKEYYIGGWYAAHHWGLTDQIPMQVDVYTTRRSGKKKLLNKRFIFHRVRPEALKKGVKKKVRGHQYIVLKKEETQKWFSNR